MPESSVTLWDIYLQVKRMKLNNPAIFLNMALSHFLHHCLLSMQQLESIKTR